MVELREEGLERPETMSWESRKEWVQGVPGGTGRPPLLPLQESDLVSLDLILTFHFR